MNLFIQLHKYVRYCAFCVFFERKQQTKVFEATSKLSNRETTFVLNFRRLKNDTTIIQSDHVYQEICCEVFSVCWNVLDGLTVSRFVLKAMILFQFFPVLLNRCNGCAVRL